MKIINLNQDLSKVNNQVVEILKIGGLVIYPSDTVYGALVDATNKQAVEKLIKFKNRPPGKAISVFVSGWKMMEELVEMDQRQREILKEILPGCFTVVLKSRKKVVNLLESEKQTLGVRLVKYEPVIDLVSKFKKPVTATSANLGGKPPHHSIDSLLKQLPKYKQELIDLIVDAGKLPRNKPSTVIDLTTPEIKILRHGDVSFYKKQEFISKSVKETKAIAKKIIFNFLQDLEKKPLIFILEGDLGVGKTVFVKGLGEYFEIKDIVSPSFVVMYEYEIKSKVPPKTAGGPPKTAGRQNSKLIHVDLYNVEEKEEFKYLGINDYLKPGNILAIEWGEKSGEIFENLRKKGKVVIVDMEYISEKERKIIIKS